MTNKSPIGDTFQAKKKWKAWKVSPTSLIWDSFGFCRLTFGILVCVFFPFNISYAREPAQPIEVEGDQVEYFPEQKKGSITKAKVKAGEWYGGGEKVDVLPDGSVKIEDGYITSCNLEKPHYKINAKNITISPDNKTVAKNVIFKVGNCPVMYLPKYNYSIDTAWPSFNMIPGSKKKWGVFALTSFRYEMSENNKMTLRLDEREKWGLGEGLDNRYALGDFGQGILRTYYTHQRDRDRQEIRMAEEERYRVQLRHRWDITGHLTGILEYHKLSDVDMTKDFFYREEYERESSPLSYIYLLESQPEYCVSFLTRKRVNRFQSVVENIPQLRFDLKEQRLFDQPIYFKTDTSFTNLNSKTGNSSTDTDVVRFDTYNKLNTPIGIADFLRVSPFMGMRDTVYTRNINEGEDEFRTAFYSGVDISTKFFKTYDASGRFLWVDFNKLHHIITPTVEYEYIHEPSLTPGKIQQFDDIDSIDRKSQFSMGIENRLQTKRLVRDKLISYDLGYFLLTGEYLYKPENGSQFSNVKGDIELTPFDWLRVESDTQYDPPTRDLQSWNLDLYIDKGEKWKLGFGSRYWQKTEHELTSELCYKLNKDWSFEVFGRYDLKEVESNGHKLINRFDSKEITIVKDLHCWLAEVSLDMDRDGGTTFWIVLKLKASPKVPFDFRDYYARPK